MIDSFDLFYGICCRRQVFIPRLTQTNEMKQNQSQSQASRSRRCRHYYLFLKIILFYNTNKDEKKSFSTLYVYSITFQII